MDNFEEHFEAMETGRESEYVTEDVTEITDEAFESNPEAMEIYLDWIKQKQIEEAQMHSTEIPRQIWGQMETSSPKESAQDPSLPEFDPLSFLWSHSTKAAELTAESGVQPQDTLFCCNKIQFMEKVGSWKAEAAVQGFLEYFMEHASSIRLGESPPTDYISPERLVVVMDSKGKKAHWFYLKEYVEDNLKIKSWEEFERAKSEPEWLYNKITTQMAETYTGTNVDKKPLFCPIHGESRWVISIAEKDVQVEQQNTTELLLTQPVSLPPFEISSEDNDVGSFLPGESYEQFEASRSQLLDMDDSENSSEANSLTN